jgi:transposase
MSLRPSLPPLPPVLTRRGQPTLVPDPDTVQVESLDAAADLITVAAATVSASAICPRCGVASRRVHSRYVRTLADLPWEGIRVRMRLRTRRFFCETPDCPRAIFTERLPAVAAPYARQTVRLDATLRMIGAALGGAAGERLAAALGMHTAGSTLLAHLRDAPAPDPPVPRVLGVDDFAWRRGRRYGTVLVDLERHRVVDVLPDRTAATFTAWLKRHEGVEIISRDRGGPYADAAHVGAPHATQVADRFHLLANLRAALESLLVRHVEDLRAVTRVRETARGAAAERRRAARLALYEQAVALHNAGVSHAEICEQLNLGRGTVRTWLRAGHFPERAAPSRAPKVPTRLAPHVEHIAARVAAGEVDVREVPSLVAELRARGYTGSGHSVRRLVVRLAHTRPHPPNAPGGVSSAGEAPSPKLPSARRVSWLLFATDEELEPADRAFVAALCAHAAALDEARRLAHAFRAMLREHDTAAFLPWMTAAHQRGLRSFVRGLRYDFEAVYAGIALLWSQGQVEGHVHRLKLVKRSMSGRASFALFRKRILVAA